MQSFKLAYTPKCSGSKCAPKKSLNMEGIEKLYNAMLSVSYLFCGCLIVYSLLMLNTSFLSQDRLSVAIEPVAVAITQAGSNIMAVAADIGSPLNGTIDVYSNALTKTFVATGNGLAKVPELLTWVPPVRARTVSSAYW
ncbi:MAG: hypothetical protein NTZ18_02080 [Candidatus Komeilibacteria bacterium]|nr:hypothetical protein [Candidatus Komeilibacteria bacterium]